MSTPSEKFDYAVHLGNVLLKDDFAGSPLCTTSNEGVVRGAIRTVIDLAVTAARAADAKEIERLQSELVMYKKCFADAIKCVDRVFQVGGQEPPLLPDFCQLGESKFNAVVRLAEAYIALTFGINAKAEAAAKEIAEFEYDAHGYRVGTDTIELIINSKFTQEAHP